MEPGLRSTEPVDLKDSAAECGSQTLCQSLNSLLPVHRDMWSLCQNASQVKHEHDI